MRKALPAICSLLLLSVLSVGCETVGADGSNEEEALAGTRWQLLSAETAEGTVQAEALSEQYTISFTGEQTEKGLSVGGKNVCNTYNGSYRIEGSSITILNVLTTEAYCSKAATQIDDALFTKVRGNASYEVSGSRLAISYETEGEKQIIFERTTENQ